MFRRYLTGIGALLLALAFFGSRQLAAGAAQRTVPGGILRDPVTQPADLAAIARLRERPLTPAETRRYVQAGPRQLDAILTDFLRSDFARRIQTRLGPGFDVGAAMDRDVYASNVVKVTEAFGPEGVRRVVRTLPAPVVRHFRFDSTDFAELGTGTAKPLLTIALFQTLPRQPPAQLATRGRAWATAFTEPQNMRDYEVTNPGVAEACPWLCGVAAGLVANALWEGGKWVYCRARGGKLTLRQGAPESQVRNLLSPPTRIERERVFRRLDPNRGVLDPARP